MEDVSEIRKMSAQLQQSQRLEAVGTLAGGIAHDFNNILSSIIGFTELSLEDVQQGTLLHDNLSEVLMAGNRAKDLVKQIMTFSQKSEPERRPVEINSLIKETIKMLRATIPTNIEIKEHLSEERFILNANPSQMNQVLVNLVTNASHAIPEDGMIRIDSGTIRFDESVMKQYPGLSSGRYVEIIVSDNGKGISREDLNQIFDPYFTTKDPDKGTGLGLAVVHGIVKSHGGHITVYSEVGEGTVFHVYLPLAEPFLKVESRPQPERLPVGIERILLVDDEPPITKMLTRNLERTGYTVISHTSSEEALKAFRSAPASFDLVITDMTMPQMTGDKLAAAVKEIRPDMPVILCTGFNEKVNVKTAPDLLIDGFLMKPVARTEMAGMVRKVLDEAKGQTQ